MWFKGNSKPLFSFQLSPFGWWLYTGLVTNYLGLTAWWFLINNYKIWGAMAITYCTHTIVELSLNLYFYDPPTMQQGLGIFMLAAGAFLILK